MGFVGRVGQAPKLCRARGSRAGNNCDDTPIQASLIDPRKKRADCELLPLCESFLSSVYRPSRWFDQGSPGLTENC